MANETLNEALASLGITRTLPGYGRVRLQRGVDVALQPMCASAGWELVRLLRGGYEGSFAAAAEKAVEVAAAASWLDDARDAEEYQDDRAPFRDSDREDFHSDG